MRVLLLGAGGMLGHDILETRPRSADVSARTRAELDIRDGAALERAITSIRPDYLVNCAGATNVDAAETDREGALAVNGTAVAHMATLCARHSVKLVHFSTDYVFDGRKEGFYSETDQPNPVNYYGLTKLVGEDAVRRSSGEHLVIRTQWLFGTNGRSFARLMCERAEAGQPTRAVSDQYACCTYTVDLAKATWDVLERATGTLHLANRGLVSRHMMAELIFEHFGATALLTACSASEFPAPAPRPANSALSVRRAEGLLGRQMGDWRQAMARYLAERESAPKTH